MPAQLPDPGQRSISGLGGHPQVGQASSRYSRRWPAISRAFHRSLPLQMLRQEQHQAKWQQLRQQQLLSQNRLQGGVGANPVATARAGAYVGSEVRRPHPQECRGHERAAASHKSIIEQQQPATIAAFFIARLATLHSCRACRGEDSSAASAPQT